MDMDILLKLLGTQIDGRNDGLNRFVGPINKTFATLPAAAFSNDALRCYSLAKANTKQNIAAINWIGTEALNKQPNIDC